MPTTTRWYAIPDPASRHPAPAAPSALQDIRARLRAAAAGSDQRYYLRSSKAPPDMGIQAKISHEKPHATKTVAKKEACAGIAEVIYISSDEDSAKEDKLQLDTTVTPMEIDNLNEYPFAEIAVKTHPGHKPKSARRGKTSATSADVQDGTSGALTAAAFTDAGVLVRHAHRKLVPAHKLPAMLAERQNIRAAEAAAKKKAWLQEKAKRVHKAAEAVRKTQDSLNKYSMVVEELAKKFKKPTATQVRGLAFDDMPGVFFITNMDSELDWK